MSVHTISQGSTLNHGMLSFLRRFLQMENSMLATDPLHLCSVNTSLQALFYFSFLIMAVPGRGKF